MGGVARGGLRPLGAQDSSSSRKSSTQASTGGAGDWERTGHGQTAANLAAAKCHRDGGENWSAGKVAGDCNCTGRKEESVS
jgi:hypothetical protein